MEESYPKQKTLWEKEKLLVMSNFSFSHSDFKRLVSQGASKGVIVWEWVKVCNALLEDGLLKIRVCIHQPPSRIFYVRDTENLKGTQRIE